MDETAVVRPGARVRWREGTPPYAANAGVVYVVRPEGEQLDYTCGDGRPYVWLTHEADVGLAPAQQRIRSGYVDALEVAP